MNKQFLMGYLAGITFMVALDLWGHYMQRWSDRYDAAKSVCAAGRIIDDGMFGYPHCLVEVK